MQESNRPAPPTASGSQSFGSVAATAWRVFWAIVLVIVIILFLFYLWILAAT